ncbi:GAF domain-containing sensor histidine kinase [Frondihabitans sp. PAMC 28766]|uniref:GAF domain-containing sensor histidine kinase n=1 Tax=Frondihabitans sp. PAMC 28766 TaxID=1795630 RepID=UPI001EF6DB61|nr:GAF domain-containing protein [Frondihabitans sp. PAMC 28766]
MSLVSNEPEVSLRLVADSVASLTRVDLVCVVAETTEGTLIIDPARGPLAEGLEGLHIPADGTQIAAVLHAQVPFVSAALDILVGTPHARTTGPIMLLPLFRQGQSIGVLVVARAPGGAPFSESELETIAMFARHASLAIDGARFRAERRRIETLQDRTRIARELHDHVIQSIFAAGLDLQAILRKSSDVELNKRLDRPIDMLDTVISEIRTAVFALRPEQPGGNFSLRRKLVNLVTELGGLFPETPRLTLAGPLDLTIDPVLGNDVVAVVREHLGNLSQEGQATKVSIGVSVTVDQAIVEIAEDDSREDTATNSPLLESLKERANHWRGSLLLEQGKPSGTRLTWMATLPTPRRGGTHS